MPRDSKATGSGDAVACYPRLRSNGVAQQACARDTGPCIVTEVGHVQGYKVYLCTPSLPHCHAHPIKGVKIYLWNEDLS